MLKKEAKEIGDTLIKITNNLSNKDQIVILNLGSQTKNFIDSRQPYIHSYIFQRFENNPKIRIINVDLQESPGVDITMDLTQEAGYDQLRGHCPDIILTSNLLEHVESIDSLISNLANYLNNDYYIVVSGSRFFSYHADPIDNLFRPSKKELRNIFAKFGFILVAHTYKYSLNVFFSTKNYKQDLLDNLFSIKILISSPKMLVSRNFMERFLPIIVFVGVFKQNFKLQNENLDYER